MFAFYILFITFVLVTTSRCHTYAWGCICWNYIFNYYKFIQKNRDA